MRFLHSGVSKSHPYDGLRHCLVLPSDCGFIAGSDTPSFASGDVILFENSAPGSESNHLSFGVVDDYNICYLASVYFTDEDGDMQCIANDRIRQELIDTVLLQDNADLQLLYDASHQEIDLSTVEVLAVIEGYPSVLKTESLPGGKLEDPHGEHSEDVWLIKYSHISNLNQGKI
jgi:hypothetical protein